jgi:hypothetical protein
VSRRRRILSVTAAALVLLLACAPMLAKTGVARRLVAGRLSEALGRPVEISGLDAGWTSGVTVTGLVVRSGEAEFQDAPLVEAASIRLEDALLSLAFSGASGVSIDGLVVRLEERAGGRTNVDDLLKGLAKPRPAPPVKAEARPFRLVLTDASVRIRRLVRRAQPRRIDPFREDPLIRDADEGLLAIGITDMDLLLDSTPGATTLALEAALDVAGHPGRADIALRLGPDGPSGHVRLEGIDLSLLKPFGLDVEGLLDLRAEGSPGGVEVKLRAAGLKAGRVAEAWAELSGQLRKEGDGVAFDNVSLRTASGAFSLDGRGAWPPRGVSLEAQASTEALGLDVKGPLLLHLTGEGKDVAGTLATPDLDARFEVTVRDGALAIRKLEAKALASSITTSGEVGDAIRLSGTADVQLGDLKPFLPEGASLEGRLLVKRFALTGDALQADAEVSGLLARGFFAEDVDIARGELHVDAALSRDRDTLRVARAQLDGLAAEGTVSGLVRGNLLADGTVKGTLALNPLHARLLGIEEVRGFRGQMTVDVTAVTGAKGTDAKGTVAIDGFHIENDRGAWDLARISAEGTYRDGNADVEAKADGLLLKGSLAGGKGKIDLDVDAVERQPLLVRLLPQELELAGPVKVRADVESRPWKIGGTLESPALTAEFRGRGVVGEEVRLSFTARETEPGWVVTAPEITLSNLGARASVGDGFLGRDGSKRGRILFEAPLDRLATVAQEVRRFAPEGNLSMDVQAAYDGRWKFDGNFSATDASVVLSRKRTPPRTARVEFDATLPDDGTRPRCSVRLTSKATALEGSATFGPNRSLQVGGRTRLEEIAPFAPMFRGTGEVQGNLHLDLEVDGRFSASASLESESIRVQGGRLQKATVRSSASGRLVQGALEEVKTSVSVQAARAERGNILVEDLKLLERGGGRSGAYSLDTRVDAARMKVGATSWEEVKLDVTGRLDTLLAERPPTGLKGDVRFSRWHLGPFLWEDARGQVALEDGSVVVKDLVATLHGGTVRAAGRITPVDDRMAWEGEARAEGIVLSEQIGRPLSFIIPFLRLQKEAGQLKGRADFDLKLAADDTTDVSIVRTLAGAGGAHLYDIEARGSILLPLLSFRLDKAILNEPFRFKDLNVSFEVGEGSIRPKPFELEATPFGIRVKEIEVGLDGTVDVLVVPGLLPLRIRGTLDDPDVRPAPLAPFR